MESVTRIINLNTDSADEQTVYIGRPSKWGNPYRVGIDGSKTEVLVLYKQHVLSTPDLINSLSELDGKTLACWCKPAKCHRDVLVELLNVKRVDSFLDY